MLFLILCIIKFKTNWVGKNELVVTNLFFPQKTFIVAKGLGLVFLALKKELYYTIIFSTISLFLILHLNNFLLSMLIILSKFNIFNIYQP